VSVRKIDDRETEMTDLSWPDEPEPEPDERSRAIQNVVSVVALMPLVLFVLVLAWSAALTSVIRYLVRPVVVDSTSS
jgi:hypothetical protein